MANCTVFLFLATKRGVFMANRTVFMSMAINKGVFMSKVVWLMIKCHSRPLGNTINRWSLFGNSNRKRNKLRELLLNSL